MRPRLHNALWGVWLAALLVAPLSTRAQGIVTTLAGDGSVSTSDGIGTLAGVFDPLSPVMSHDRSRIFFCSYSGRNVRQMVLSTGAVTTIAGSPTSAPIDVDFLHRKRGPARDPRVAVVRPQTHWQNPALRQLLDRQRSKRSSNRSTVVRL